MKVKALALAMTTAILCAAAPAEATVLARCGGSKGQAFYETDGSWIADGISKGSFEFLADDKGNPNVHFVDVTGARTDSAADGAQLTFAFIHPDRGEFGIVAVYEATGVVETYNVIVSATGKRRLLWTSNKSNAAAVAKVSAFVAACA